MSREDLVFTKKAIVVVAVLSVLGAVAVGGASAAWGLSRMRDDITTTATQAATAAAVAAAQAAIAPVREQLARHEAVDDGREQRLRQDVDEVRGLIFRPAWDPGPALPADRRRSQPRATPAP